MYTEQPKKLLIINILDILKKYAVNNAELASAAASLDAQASVGFVEYAAVYGKVLHAASNLASQRQRTVPELHKAVADSVVVGGLFIKLCKVNLSRLDCDTIVAHAELAADNVYVIARLGVKTVRVGAVFRRVHRYIEEIDIL